MPLQVFMLICWISVVYPKALLADALLPMDEAVLENSGALTGQGRSYELCPLMVLSSHGA